MFCDLVQYLVCFYEVELIFSVMVHYCCVTVTFFYNEKINIGSCENVYANKSSKFRTKFYYGCMATSAMI